MLEKYSKRPGVHIRQKANPLSTELRCLARFLDSKGYALGTIQHYLRSVEHFGHWLEQEQFPITDVDQETVQRFLNHHLSECTCPPPCPKKTKEIGASLKHLLGVIEQTSPSDRSPPPRHNQIDRSILPFQQYLEDNCGLALSTQVYRVRYVREFLVARYGNGPVRLKNLKPQDVMRFVSNRARSCKPGTAKVIATSLRSYLRYLQLQGVNDGTLVKSVPTIPWWPLSNVPRTMSDDQVHVFLSSFDRSTPTGKRDYAMALCLLELGLRASEVAQLSLDDINWHEGTMQIALRKSCRSVLLPLPRRVGHAIASYLRRGRPKIPGRQLFVRHSVPRDTAVGPELVRGAMRRAYARAGFPSDWTGTHILRHTAATRMHQRGATLKEVADVLGHRSLDTTAIYTKVNIPMLRCVALPWPEVKS